MNRREMTAKIIGMIDSGVTRIEYDQFAKHGSVSQFRSVMHDIAYHKLNIVIVSGRKKYYTHNHLFYTVAKIKKP